MGISRFSALNISQANSPAAVGGKVIELGGYRIHIYDTVGFQVIQFLRSISVDVLIVAGGGSGGHHTTTNANGGGGAGGILSTTSTPTVGNQDVSVGAGGAAIAQTVISRGNIGSSSGFMTLSVPGGGGGATTGSALAAFNGGSGGGSATSGGVAGTSTISGTGYYGNSGGGSPVSWTGGGGGGAGSVGQTGSAGGDGGLGISSSLTGSVKYYAGGGGGGGNSSETAGDGWHGGGRGAGTTGYYGYQYYPEEVNPVIFGSGTPNAIAGTGGGGGAGSYWSPNGFWSSGSGRGASGVVVIRYLHNI